MKPNQTIHLGDGAYLHFDGYGLEFRTNHHKYPTDTVYVENIKELFRILQETIEQNKEQSCQHPT